MSDEKIVEFKPFFEKKYGSRCGKEYQHVGPFLIDSESAWVECKACKAQLNPIAVLEILMDREQRYHRFQKFYYEAKKDLEHRIRTKCDNCGKMTRIKIQPRLL